MGYFYYLLVDPSTFLLVYTAALILLYSAHRSLQFYLIQLQNANPEVTEAAELTTKVAILLPIVGSVFLVVLFYFLAGLYYLLLLLFTFSSLFSFAYVIYPSCEYLRKQTGYLKKDITIKVSTYINEEVPTALLIGIVISILFITIWLIVRTYTLGWILTDVLALSLAISALSFLRLPNLPVCIVMLGLFFFYDIFWVFISPLIFSKNVMVHVARGLPSLPMVILVPRLILDNFSLLGLGDIILPGLFICFLHRFDRCNLKSTSIAGVYLRVGLIGYCIGLYMAWVAVVTMGMAQPALLYLVPCTMIPTIILAHIRGDLKGMWKGIDKHRNEDITAEPFDIEIGSEDAMDIREEDDMQDVEGRSESQESDTSLQLRSNSDEIDITVN